MTADRHAAVVVALGMTVGLCSGCGSTATAPSSSPVVGSPSLTTGPACDVGKPGPPSIASVFADHLPRSYAVKEICAADVGPGLAGADVVAALSDVVAGVVAEAEPPLSGKRGDFSPDSVELKALVGTAASGDGDAFVDAFQSRIGETRNDTVTLGGRQPQSAGPSPRRYLVRYFNTPGGEGYAYADGPTVAIGFIPPPRADLAVTQESAKVVFTRILAAATGSPIPADALARTDNGIETYAPGRGRYTKPATRAGSSSRSGT